MSHFRPRTRDGRIAVVLFVMLFAFTQPPLVFVLAKRMTPWLLGLPFLYVYLLGIYFAMIVVLIWAFRRGL